MKTLMRWLALPFLKGVLAGTVMWLAFQVGVQVRLEFWRRGLLGEKDGQDVEGIPHGMCNKCYAKVKGERIMNLKGWKYLFAFGDSLDIYAKGDRRVGIGRKTGEVVIKYKSSDYYCLGM